MEKITLLETNKGKGFKVVHNGQWFYASKQNFNKFMLGQYSMVHFYSMALNEERPVEVSAKEQLDALSEKRMDEIEAFRASQPLFKG